MFYVLGGDPLLPFLYSGKNLRYVYYIWRRSSLTFSIFGEESPLRFHYLAEILPYVSTADRSTAVRSKKGCLEIQRKKQMLI